MKTSNSILPLLFIVILFSIYCISACKNSGEQKSDMANKPDTSYVERIDTMVIFNPDSPDVETIRILKSIDTVITK